MRSDAWREKNPIISSVSTGVRRRCRGKTPLTLKVGPPAAVADGVWQNETIDDGHDLKAALAARFGLPSWFPSNGRR